MNNSTQPKGTPLAAGSTLVSGTRALSITIENDVAGSVAEADDKLAPTIVPADTLESNEGNLVATGKGAINKTVASAPVAESAECAEIATPAQPPLVVEVQSDHGDASGSAIESPVRDAGYVETLALLEQASQSFNAVFNEAGAGVTKLSHSMMAFIQINAHNNMELARDYMAVRSLPEALEIQNIYVKRQFDLLTTQVEALQILAAEMADKTAAPFKVHVRH